MTTSPEIVLPYLGKSTFTVPTPLGLLEPDVFTREETLSYARAAVLADRASVADRGVQAVPGERYCLVCEKSGHLTTECQSTHGLNTPEDRELHRICALAASVASPAAPASPVVPGELVACPDDLRDELTCMLEGLQQWSMLTKNTHAEMLRRLEAALDSLLNPLCEPTGGPAPASPSVAQAEPSRAAGSMSKEARQVGALMANTMFNLAQQTRKFDDYHRNLFKSMQVKWDAAIRASAEEAQAEPSELESRRANQSQEGTQSELWRIGLLEWGVAGWRSEVQHRPAINIYRQRLDDFWRRVIRKAGGDPDALVGPEEPAPDRPGVASLVASEDTKRLNALTDPAVMSKLDFDSHGAVFVLTEGGWFETSLRQAIDAARIATLPSTPKAEGEQA
jgi:hypothetical protein